MKLRSSHLPPCLLVSLTTCAVIPAALCEGSEEPDKVLFFDDIDSLITPEQLEKIFPQKPAQSPFPFRALPISFHARIEEDWEMVSILAKRSCRGRGVMLPWEQSENFIRPFAKSSSVSHGGKAKYQASKQK